jgi:hypothetical protein
MTADQLLNALFNAGIAISVGATVLSLGMTFTIAQLLAPLGRVGLVILMVVLNAVAIPAIAWGSPRRSPSATPTSPVWSWSPWARAARPGSRRRSCREGPTSRSLSRWS